MAKSKVKHGKKDLLEPGELDPKKAKVRISLFIDGDVLMAFKEAAKETSSGEYQTLMREKLREAMFGKRVDTALKETIREVVREELGKAS
jgi:uncharacterized protein (DUF4415 family)